MNNKVYRTEMKQIKIGDVTNKNYGVMAWI